jgi:DNA-binding transcriptional regulator YhcF (GntR family)
MPIGADIKPMTGDSNPVSEETRSAGEDLNPVKRAYQDLDNEGIIYRKQGLGTFVSDNGLACSREVKRLQAEDLLRQAIREGVEAGLADSELLKLAKRLLKEKGD